jgi:uncharacterized protein YqfB (UPF0267 family)
MTVLMFYPRFHEQVETGRKTQTIRGNRKKPIKPGDSLSLRGWTGRPYDSPQRVLALGVCSSVTSVEIEVVQGVLSEPFLTVAVAGVYLDEQALEDFAVADGFANAHDMLCYYRKKRTLYFEGVLIRWEV